MSTPLKIHASQTCIHSLIHSSVIHSVTCSYSLSILFAHSIHSFIHLFIHPFIHSFIHYFSILQRTSPQDKLATDCISTLLILSNQQASISKGETIRLTSRFPRTNCAIYAITQSPFMWIALIQMMQVGSLLCKTQPFKVLLSSNILEGETVSLDSLWILWKR